MNEELIVKLDDLIEAHHILPGGKHTLAPVTAEVYIDWILEPLKTIPKTGFTIFYLIEIAERVRLLLGMDTIIVNNRLSLRDNIYVEIAESFVPENGMEWLLQSKFHYNCLGLVKISGLSADQVIQCGQRAHYCLIAALLLDALFPPAPSTEG